MSYRWDDDLLVEEIISANGNNYSLQYSYDNNNRISEVKCAAENVFYKYIYNGDKLIKIEDYYDNVLGATTDFTYTSEGTPDYLAMQFDRTFNFINRNDIIEWKRSIPSLGDLDIPVVVKVEYTYSDDYTTTQIITDEHNGTVVKTTFTY